MEHPSNAEVARALDEIADHIDHSGRARYAARAYRRAAVAIRRQPFCVGALAMAGRATELRGVGESIASRIVELCETGTIAELERMRERTPPELMLLARLPGVNAGVAEAIWEAIAPTSLDDLAAAAADGRLLQVPRVGPRTAEAVEAGIAMLEHEPELVAEPLLRSHARRAAEDVAAAIRSFVPDVLRVHEGGPLVRGCELVDVVDVLVVTPDASGATAAIRDRLDTRGWHATSEEAVVDEECLTFALQAATGAGVRIHVTDPAHEARSLLFAIGPEHHAREVLDRSEAGPDAPGPTTGPSDAVVYEAAGLQYVPCELRDRPGILDEAATGSIPRLVEVPDLHGDMHCHSTWSDGRASIADMAHAAIERGYGHLVITDHSHSLRIVNGLTPAGIAAQRRDIEELRAELADVAPGFELLQGTEMEILPDGSLDFDDAVLASLDFVVASIHSRQRQPPEEITRRMERAMRNPLVDCIGHPTSRLLLRRAKTGLDTDRLIELAAATGTFLEINSAPDRLDLDAPTADRARQAGVLLCIDSDAHGPETLGLVEHGVATARRAGLTRAHVVNARPWSELRELQPRWRA